MKKVFLEVIPYIVIIIVVLLIKKFIITPVRVQGPSMEHTLLDKDIMLLEKVSYRFNEIKRFDIVVINTSDKKIIKRVIGLPGDYVKFSDNKLYINDKYYEEKYLDGNTVTEDFKLEDIFDGSKIPKDYYLVLGDNREVSKDSRSIGLIKRNDIDGHAIFTLFPFNRIGIKK